MKRPTRCNNEEHSPAIIVTTTTTTKERFTGLFGGFGDNLSLRCGYVQEEDHACASQARATAASQQQQERQGETAQGMATTLSEQLAMQKPRVVLLFFCDPDQTYSVQVRNRILQVLCHRHCSNNNNNVRLGDDEAGSSRNDIMCCVVSLAEQQQQQETSQVQNYYSDSLCDFLTETGMIVHTRSVATGLAQYFSTTPTRLPTFNACTNVQWTSLWGQTRGIGLGMEQAGNGASTMAPRNLWFGLCPTELGSCTLSDSLYDFVKHNGLTISVIHNNTAALLQMTEDQIRKHWLAVFCSRRRHENGSFVASFARDCQAIKCLTYPNILLENNARTLLLA